MEVTKDNFRKAYSILEKEIQFADFIAIDAEFTGLSSIRNQGTCYDTPEDVYKNTLTGTSKMLMIQYGVCLFIWKWETYSYEAIPFTFYIYPRLYKSYGNDVLYMSQSSSINYLAQHGFDFNKLFHHGISFMSLEEENKALNCIEEDMKFYQQQQKTRNLSVGLNSSINDSKVFVPEDQRKFIDNISNSITSFMDDEACQCMDLPNCDPSQNKLICEIVEERYPIEVCMETVTCNNADKFLRAHKTGISMVNEHQKEIRKNERLMLEEIIGFSNIIKLIVKSKKPIIGHNMMFDLFLTVTNFFGPPPPFYADFKKIISELFPIIFDTKVMARSSPLNEFLFKSDIQSLVEFIDTKLLPDPKVVLSKKIQFEAGYKSQYHQAGFDAYCTGLVFISLANYLSFPLFHHFVRINVSSTILDCFINCIYIMGIRDLFSSNLTKNESVYKRNNVFYVKFPKSWMQSNLAELFLPFCTINYPINWINEESAFITVSNDDIQTIFTNFVLRSTKENVYSVMTYDDYIGKKNPKKVLSTDAEAPRKRKRIDSVQNHIEI